MTNRERILAVLENKKADRIPWAPRLEIWYSFHNAKGTLPEKYKGRTIKEVRQLAGVANPGRESFIVKTEYKNVEITEKICGSELVKIYTTPVGTVVEKFAYTSEGKDLGVTFDLEHTEHMIKTLKDYKVVEYIVENSYFVDNFKSFKRYDEGLGGDGLATKLCDHDPMYKIIKDYVGYNNVYYEMYDNPTEIESLYRCCYRKRMELLELLKQSPAKLIIHGAHFDSMMTPPPLFEKYMKPYYQEFSKGLHESGKMLAVHADADSKLLMGQFIESGIDMVECFCTAPMVTVSMEEAIDFWEDKMIIWGGIPSILLVPESVSYDEFITYVEKLLELIRTKKGRVILGIADNLMPEGDITRVEKISEMVERFSL